MFKDYYAVLGLEQTYDSKVVEDAVKNKYSQYLNTKNYKKLADVVEAQKILLDDPQIKEKYDIEYGMFRRWQTNRQDGAPVSDGDSVADASIWAEYNVQDFSLADDISVARKIAEELAHELGQTVKTATGGAFHEAMPWVIAGVILLAFGLLIRACM